MNLTTKTAAAESFPAVVVIFIQKLNCNYYKKSIYEVNTTNYNNKRKLQYNYLRSKRDITRGDEIIDCLSERVHLPGGRQKAEETCHGGEQLRPHRGDRCHHPAEHSGDGGDDGPGQKAEGDRQARHRLQHHRRGSRQGPWHSGHLHADGQRGLRGRDDGGPVPHDGAQALRGQCEVQKQRIQDHRAS